MSSQYKPAPVQAAGTGIQTKLLLTLLVIVVIPVMILGVSLVVGAFQSAAIVAAVLVQFVGFGLAWHVASGIVKQAASINEALVSINNGNFEARATTVTRDELGLAADSLNAMCDNSLNLMQSNDERDQMQTSIEYLTSEMNQIAAGDLTIVTRVNDDMTGPIAHSVNDMTEQLRSIVQQVQSAAGQVTALSGDIREVSTSNSKESDSVAQHIGEVSRQLMEMTGSFQQVAGLTKESADVAIDARQTASRGLKAVSDTVDGMQRIRNQVQCTSKRIKTLGESSQEIGEIVQLISDITDRTSILAMNASIQAAMAGDAGRGFAVVAEEIERLAESSKDATQQISKLIRAIQNGTGEVISDMEESTREVVAGSRLATQAGETLFEIDSISNQLVELIQGSSVSALQQAENATTIANIMSGIAGTTMASAEKGRESTRSVGRLAAMVSRLCDSVSQFKVDSGQGRIDRRIETRDVPDESTQPQIEQPVEQPVTQFEKSESRHEDLLQQLRDTSAMISSGIQTGAQNEPQPGNPVS